MYELDHGCWPSRLDLLVPDYLDAVPIDPFTDPPKPLGYKTDPSQLWLHSVGRNGVVDGDPEAVRKARVGTDDLILHVTKPKVEPR